VVQFPVQPDRHNLLHLGKIPNHPDRIQIFRLELDLDSAVMPVEMAAFALVIHEPVAVAEMKGLGDFVHERLR